MKNNKTKMKNGGRPKMEAGERKDEVISFRTDKVTRLALDYKVKEAKRTMGDFIRCAIKKAQISIRNGEKLLNQVNEYSYTDLLNEIVISSKVVPMLSKDELKCFNGLYRFAQDINALVKRGNAALAGSPEIEKINYPLEMARLQDEFDEIKNFFQKKIIRQSGEEGL